jgi:predicted dehydrogenase
MVGHLLEYHPAIRKIHELIADGLLGKLYYVISNRVNLGKIRTEENALWSFAPHDIAIILRMVGQMPFEVVATGGSYLQPNIADVTVTQLLFDNGMRAHIFVSWLHPFKEQKLVLIGSKNMVSYDDVSKELLLYDQHVEIKDGMPVPLRGPGQKVPFPEDEPLRLECQHFLECIRERRQPLTDGPSGLRVLEVLQAAQRSLVTNGEPVQFPLYMR